MDYILADPTGNITALVTSEVAQEERLSVVKEIFDTEPSCEQVGFVRVTGEGRVTLEMMGGEFCGNATLSAAAYCAKTNELFNTAESTYRDTVENSTEDIIPSLYRTITVIVDSSGIDNPVPVELTRLAEDLYEGTLEMPMPRVEGTLVHLDGISHMIVPADMMSHEEAEAAIKGYADEFGVAALGIILYLEDGLERSYIDEDDAIGSGNQGSVTIEPLVYVKGSNTMVWEHGCASGSIAAACYKHSETGASKVNVYQPGCIITIDIEDGKLYLTGQINL